MVLDNLLVKQINETDALETDIQKQNPSGIKQECQNDVDAGHCKANFTRYYYSSINVACIKVKRQAELSANYLNNVAFKSLSIKFINHCCLDSLDGLKIDLSNSLCNL